jgi:hypothetical protein
MLQTSFGPGDNNNLKSLVLDEIRNQEMTAVRIICWRCKREVMGVINRDIFPARLIDPETNRDLANIMLSRCVLMNYHNNMMPLSTLTLSSRLG